MGAKTKSKNTSKKSSKSKDKKEKSKDKKSSKDVKKKSSKEKSKSKDKSKKSDMPKVQDEKDLPEMISNDEKENIEKANLIQNLSVKNQTQLVNFPPNNINPPQLIQEKCEGCYQGDGILFCNECGKIFCKTCDEQLHVIPSFKDHERIPLEAFSETKMQCYHHNQPLMLFCETCHEPICSKCQKMGPHNTSLHKVSSLFQAYKKFLETGKNYINGPLKAKTLKLEELMLQIDNALNDSKGKAKDLLRNISAEYESVIEKITKLDGNKKAELSFNSSEFQKDMLNIQRILETLDKKNMSYYSNENGGNTKSPVEEDENDRIINFLLQYKSLINEIDQLISKPINKVMTKEDEEKILKWPKELNDSKEKLINYEKYKKIIKVKDDIIWKLLTTQYEENCPELYEIEKKSNEEIAKWTQLIEKTKLELSKYNLVCSYCGVNLENGMNSTCPLNTVQNQFDNKNFTNEVPPEQAHGTAKHFFSEPTEEYQKKVDNGELFDPNNALNNTSEKESKKNKSNKSINDLLRPSISSDWVNKSARIIEKENINLFQVLSEIDIRGTGYLNIRELIRGMEKIKIVLTEEDKTSLKKYLKLSGISENKIDIKNFAQNFGKTCLCDNPCRNSNSKYSNSSRNFSNSRNNNNFNINNNENFPQNSSNGFKGFKNTYTNSNNFGDTIPKSMTYPQMNPINNNDQAYQTNYN